MTKPTITEPSLEAQQADVCDDLFAKSNLPDDEYHPYGLGFYAYEQSPVFKRMAEVLKFYGSNDNWFGPGEDDDGNLTFGRITQDDLSPVTSKTRLVGGKRARDLLRELGLEGE